MPLRGNVDNGGGLPLPLPELPAMSVDANGARNGGRCNGPVLLRLGYADTIDAGKVSC